MNPLCVTGRHPCEWGCRPGVCVLSGQLEIIVAGRQVILSQGDAFTFPTDTRHTFRAAPQAGLTQVLWVVSPALHDGSLYAQAPADDQDPPAGRQSPAIVRENPEH